MSAWIVSHNLIDQLVAAAIELEVIHPSNAQDTGAMLKRANLKSIRARYGREDEGAAEASRKRYWYRRPGTPLTLVAILKQVSCYDYQTCEFDEYPRSRAAGFVRNMERALEKRGITRDSPGYAQAPWGV